MSGLWHHFLTKSGRGMAKWTHYFPAYEQHLSRYVNRPALLVEIGVDLHSPASFIEIAKSLIDELNAADTMGLSSEQLYR